MHIESPAQIARDATQTWWTSLNYMIRVDAVLYVVAEDDPNFQGSGRTEHFLTFFLTNGHTVKNRYVGRAARDDAFRAFHAATRAQSSDRAPAIPGTPESAHRNPGPLDGDGLL